MFELPKGFLWPDLEKEVRQAFCCPGRLEDDGSNLRMLSVHSGNVQILQFISRDDPVKVKISDSITSMIATISASALDGKRDYLSIGALVKLHEFEIVITHLGSEEARLTLLIKKLEVRPESKIFGKPTPIHQKGGIRPFLEDVKKWRRKKQSRSPSWLSTEDFASQSPFHARSVRNSLGGGESSDPGSQFLTQIPTQIHQDRNGYNKSPVVEVLSQDDSAEIQSQVDIEEAPDNDTELQIKNHSDPSAGGKLSVRGFNNPLSPSEKSLLNQPSELLALAPKARSTRNTVTDNKRQDDPEKAPRSAREAPVGPASHSTKNIAEAVQESAKVERGSEANLITPNGKLSNKIRTPDHNQVSKSSIEETNGSDVQPSPSKGHPTNRTSRVDSQVEENIRIGSDVVPTRLGHPSTNGRAREEDPWNGMKRIRPKDVQIQKDQQELLDKSNCWFPPEPGSRAPVANVPLAVLQSLGSWKNDKPRKRPKLAEVESTKSSNRSPRIASRLSSPKTPREKRSDFVEPNNNDEASHKEADDHETDSDAFSWSPSPPRKPPLKQLPPDSSPIRAQRLEDRGEINQPRNITTDLSESFEVTTSSPIHETSLNLHESNYRVGTAAHNPIMVTSSRSDQVTSSNQDHNVDIEAPIRIELGHDSAVGQVSHKGTPLHDHISPHSSPRASQHSLNPSQQRSSSISSHRTSLTTDSRSRGHYRERLREGISNHQLPLHNSPSTRKQLPANCLPLNFGFIQARTNELSSSDSESELETAIPYSLDVDHAKTFKSKHAPTNREPTIASEQTKSVVQVTRTPNNSGEAKNASSLSNSNTTSSLRNSTTVKSAFSVPENSTKPRRSQCEVILGSVASEVLPNGSIQPEHISGSTPGVDPFEPSIKPSTHNQNAVRSANASMHGNRRSPENLKASLSSDHVRLSDETKTEDPYEKPKNKRKGPELDIDSRHVTKRRKRHRRHIDFAFSQDPKTMEDPSIIGREHRREFLASLKDLHRDSKAERGRSSELEEADLDAISTASTKRIRDIDVDDPDLVHEGVTLDTEPGKAVSSEKPSTAPVSKSADQRPSLVHDTTTESGTLIPTQVDQSSLANPSPASDTLPGVPSTPSPTNIFQKFQSVYPEYPGNLQHFVTMGRKIEKLIGQNRMEHRSLWDDFIIRSKQEYSEYIQDCMDVDEYPMPYESFYRDEIEDSKYRKRVVTPDTLAEVLTLGDSMPVLARRPSNGTLGSTNSALATPKPVDTSISSAPQPLPDRTSPTEVMIDLTQDDQENPRKETSQLIQPLPSPTKSRRSLPWTTNGITQGPALVTPSKPSPLKAVSTPYPLPTNVGLVSRSRSIISSRPDLASVTPSKPNPFKQFSTSRPANANPVSKARPPFISKLKSAFVTPSNPNPVKQFSNPAPPPTNASSLSEAKSPPPPQQISRPLEHISNVDAPDATQSVSKSAESSSQGEWWKDKNTPFKEFASAFFSVRPGNGNNFRKNGDAKRKTSKKGYDALAKKKTIDVLGWKL